mgnify:CR=1 FL=1
MKKSRNSDKLFPLYKHPTDALPAPNGADFGVWGHCPQQAVCGEMDSHKHCLPQYAAHKMKKLTTGRLLPPIVSFLCLSDL